MAAEAPSSLFGFGPSADVAAMHGGVVSTRIAHDGEEVEVVSALGYGRPTRETSNKAFLGEDSVMPLYEAPSPLAYRRGQAADDLVQKLHAGNCAGMECPSTAAQYLRDIAVSVAPHEELKVHASEADLFELSAPTGPQLHFKHGFMEQVPNVEARRHAVDVAHQVLPDLLSESSDDEE